MTNVELLPDVVRDVRGVPRSAAMRALAVGLLLATGCNQIFGLHDDLQPRDARFVDFQDGMYWPMSLTWQLVADPSGAVTYPPIAGATVQIGPIDPSAGPMVSLPVDPMTGNFLLPRETPNQPYRLVYTVDSLATELQSQLNSGHFVVPMVGRIDREPTPSHALLDFAPNPLPTINPIPNALILTAGLWTSSRYPNGDQINLPYTYDYQANGVSMAGTQGSLRNDKSDVEIVCSTSAVGDVTGYAVMKVDQLFENGMGIATAASSWVETQATTTVKWITPNDNSSTDPIGRLTAAVNNYGSTATTKVQWAGVIPSSIVPNFIQPNPGGLDGFQLAPLSKYDGVNPHTFVNPFATAVSGAVPTALPTAALVQNTTTRTTASGAQLTSGFQGIGLPPSPAASVDMHYNVGIAHLSGNDVTLKPEGGTSTTLTGADDTLVVALGGAPLVDLTFGTDRPVDDCVVTLYRISGTTVTPVRRLLLQQPPTSTPFKIDASVFAPATTYTLGIVCRKGQTGIATGDYSAVSYPYLTSTLYTPTFTVTP